MHQTLPKMKTILTILVLLFICLSCRTNNRHVPDTQKKNIQTLQAEIPLVDLAEGMHMLSVVAENAVSHYRLAWDEEDERLAEPLPVVIQVPFNYSGK